jgi:tellurite resistance protein
MKLDAELAQLYAHALIAIAEADRAIGPDEVARLTELVAQHAAITIDFEGAFFSKVTSDKLAAAARKAGVDARELGRAFVSDGVALSLSDGELGSAEAQAILRYARALGLTNDDIGAVTSELNEWL